MSNQKVAVIGANGFVGRKFIELAQKSAIEIVPITRQDLDLQSKLYGCNAVIILAALTPKKECTLLQNNQRFMDNLRIAEDIYCAIAKSTITQILYISSDAVYSPGVSEINEESRTEPENLYGLAHLVREKLFLNISANKQLCILRPCALYGLGDPHNGYGPNRFIREALSKQRVVLFGKGEELRNHLCVMDFAHIMLQVIKNNITGLYNVAPREPISFFNIARLITEISDQKISLEFVDRSIALQHKVHVSNKLIDALDDFEFKPLAKGVDLMYKGLVFGSSSKECFNAGS